MATFSSFAPASLLLPPARVVLADPRQWHGFARAGYETRFNELKASSRLDQIGGTYAGIEQSEQVLEFLWNEGFVAVAGDQPAFEAWREWFLPF